jgi:hypothetical protein
VLLRGNVVTGATFAFRAEAKDLVLPFSPAGWHDLWIALLVAGAGTVYAVDAPLIDYRVHGSNATGVPAGLTHELGRRRTEREIRRAMGDQWEHAAQRLRSIGTDEASVRRLDEKAEHLRARARLSASPARRAASVWAELVSGRYRRCSAGARTVAFDVLYGGR